MMQGRAPRKWWHLRHVNDAGRDITHGVLHACDYFLADERRPRADRRCAQEEGVRTTAAAGCSSSSSGGVVVVVVIAEEHTIVVCAEVQLRAATS